MMFGGMTEQNQMSGVGVGICYVLQVAKETGVASAGARGCSVQHATMLLQRCRILVAKACSGIDQAQRPIVMKTFPVVDIRLDPPRSTSPTIM